MLGLLLLKIYLKQGKKTPLISAKQLHFWGKRGAYKNGITPYVLLSQLGKNGVARVQNRTLDSSKGVGLNYILELKPATSSSGNFRRRKGTAGKRSI